MSGAKVITAATGLPVTLMEVKNDLGIYHTERDDVLQTMTEAAVAFSEKFTGQIFRYPPETVEQAFADFTNTDLNYGPVSGVTQVTYFNSSNEETTLPTGNYTVINHGMPGRVEYDGMISVPAIYGRRDAVRVRYTAGYATANDVPADVRTAIILTVRHLYESAGNQVKQMPTTAEWLLRNHRIR